MKKRFVILVLIMNLFFHFSYAKKSVSKFFSKADKFLSTNVQEGMVDYIRIKNTPKELDELIALIATINIQEEDSSAQKAYFINVYNLLVIKSVIDFYPVRTPVEYLGLFSEKRHKVGPLYYSLNDIESLIMHRFKDVRVLFLLSSASIGSPKLASYAYEPKRLEKQLEERVKLMCEDDEYIRVAKNTSTILMAEAFKNSQIRFKKEELITAINKFRKVPLPQGFRLDFYPANRQLNFKGVEYW